MCVCTCGKGRVVKAASSPAAAAAAPPSFPAAPAVAGAVPGAHVCLSVPRPLIVSCKSLFTHPAQRHRVHTPTRTRTHTQAGVHSHGRTYTQITHHHGVRMTAMCVHHIQRLHLTHHNTTYALNICQRAPTPRLLDGAAGNLEPAGAIGRYGTPAAGIGPPWCLFWWWWWWDSWAMRMHCSSTGPVRVGAGSWRCCAAAGAARRGRCPKHRPRCRYPPPTDGPHRTHCRTSVINPHAGRAAPCPARRPAQAPRCWRRTSRAWT